MTTDYGEEQLYLVGCISFQNRGYIADGDVLAPITNALLFVYCDKMACSHTPCRMQCTAAAENATLCYLALGSENEVFDKY